MFACYLIIGMVYFMYVIYLSENNKMRNYHAYLSWILSFPYIIILGVSVLLLKFLDHLKTPR